MPGLNEVVETGLCGSLHEQKGIAGRHGDRWWGSLGQWFSRFFFYKYFYTIEI